MKVLSKHIPVTIVSTLKQKWRQEHQKNEVWRNVAPVADSWNIISNPQSTNNKTEHREHGRVWDIVMICNMLYDLTN
jgi:hypothetical protein